MSVRRLTGEAFVYSVGSALEAAAGIAIVAVIGRYLTPSQLGIVDVIMASAGFLYFLICLNLDQALVRYYYTEPEDGQRRLATTHALFTIASGLLVAAVGAGVVYALGPALKEHGAWVLSFFMMAFIALGNHMATLFRVRHEPMHHAAVLGIRAVSWAIAISLFLIVWNAGVIAIFAGRLIGAALAVFVSAHWLRTAYAKRGGLALAKRSARFAVPTLPAGLAAWAILHGPRYFLAVGASYEQVGYYGIGVRISYLIYFLGVGITMAWAPHIMGMRDQPEIPATLGRGLLHFLVVNVFVVIPLAAFSRELVRVLVGANYAPASGLVAPMLVAMVFSNIALFLFTQISLSERTHWQSVSYLAGAGVMAVLNLILIPLWQSGGAALATLIGQMVVATVMFAAAQRLVKMDLAVARIAGAFLALALVGIVATWLAESEQITLASIGLKCSLVLLGWAICAVSLGPREIRSLANLARALITRKGTLPNASDSNT